jgi:hypothetical protein
MRCTSLITQEKCIVVLTLSKATRGSCQDLNMLASVLIRELICLIKSINHNDFTKLVPGY